MLIPSTQINIMSNMSNQSRPVVGYLLKTYPKISETFILNEILELERQGINLHLFSLKLPEDDRNHPKVAQVKAPVTYIPLMRQRKQFNWRGTLALVQAHWTLFWQNRQRYITAFKSAWNHPEHKPIEIFLQAGYLARQLQILGITHLQTHFANIPTAVTEIVQQLTGISYSIFAHAKDIYLTPEGVLDRRMAKAEFVLTCTGFNYHFLQQVSTSSTPIHLSYHGIDFSLFDGERNQPETDVPLMMSVGRFCQKKGFPYLIRACQILKKKGLKFRCAIVGYGPMKDDLAALIELLDLQDVISLPGKMAQDELVEIYRKASLFVLPCLVTDDGDRDGIPNVLLEAMAMQLPVVSTDISGISEVVRSGQNGFLVPQKDAAALAVQLETLLTQPELRKQFGQAGRKQVIQQFSLDRNVGEIRDLLIEVTQPSAPPESQFVRQVPALVSL
jgi:glycosyltransferase involved in cell wall biosynthesis